MHPYDRVARFVLPVGGFAVLLTVMAVGWFTQPDRFVRGYAPEQPLPFSHALHAGTMKVACAYCHSGVTRSRSAALPSTETCMGCHRITRTDRPAIQKLIQINSTQAPLAWRRVHVLPDVVFFDHRPHVHAGILCQTCHGEVETMSVLSQQMSMRMGNCLACHRDPRGVLPLGSTIRSGPDDCTACHR
jgi:hypothetical protein